MNNNTLDYIVDEFVEDWTIKDSEELLDEYVESWFADDYLISAENLERGIEYIPSDV